MQAVVTVVGQYGGEPAFEYEIREESGALAAVDFVVVHPGPGEGWAEGEAVVLAFLRRRAGGPARTGGAGAGAAGGGAPRGGDACGGGPPGGGRGGPGGGAGGGRGAFSPPCRRAAP